MNLPTKAVAQPTQYEAFAIFDVVKIWVFERLDLVLKTFNQALNKGEGVTSRDIHELRANCLTLYIALEQKVERQKVNFNKDEVALVGSLNELLKAPATEQILVEGRLPTDQLKFWAKVVRFESKVLDLVGITRIDLEKKDQYDQATGEMFNA